jgi:hypothetical protein
MLLKLYVIVHTQYTRRAIPYGYKLCRDVSDQDEKKVGLLNEFIWRFNAPGL